MLPLARIPGHRAMLLLAATALLAPIILLGCQPATRPTVSPAPTMDLVGTVTAQAAPAAATQTAISAAATQVVELQATATALVQAQTAVAGQTAAAQNAASTQAAVAVAATAQGATATALAQVAAAQAVTATALAQAAAAQAGTATALARAVTIPPASATPVAASGTPAITAVPCVALDPALAAIAAKATNAGLDLGCPTGPAARTANGALQDYWANAASPDPATHTRSLMVWYGDAHTIYVIRGRDAQASQGPLLSYIDTWQEGDPEIMPACASLQPPAGYLAPVRGFGKAWCANNLAGVIGWPNGKETAATLLIQPTRYGLLLKISAPDQNAGYVAALDFRAVYAVTTNVGP